MATYIASKHSENPTESILGHKENVEIDKIGTFLSKLDTGNGRYSVLHGDNIKVRNDIVTFEVDNKTFEFPLEEIAKVKTGAVSSTIEKRPVIKLNTKLNGKTLKNEPFFITDRSDKTTPALLSRALLQRARVIIDPSKKHTMKESTRYKGVVGYLKEEKKVTIKELSDTALVMLSVLAVGSALPAVIDKNVDKELKNNNFISKSNKVTPSGLQYLKQPRMIVRLSKIGSR